MFFDKPERNDEDALVAALVALQRRKEKAASRLGNDFSRVVDHFEKRSKRLEQERRTTSELIRPLVDGLSRIPAAAPPSLVSLTGCAGTRAVAHVRIANESARPTQVSLVVGEPDRARRLPVVSIAPNHFTLAAGESSFVELAIELAAEEPPGTFTLPVECRTPDRRERLQLVVTITERGACR